MGWGGSSQSLNKQIASRFTQHSSARRLFAGNGRKETRTGSVNISSRAILGKTERSAYAAAKSGLIGFTRVWALELAADGITVNAVAPGPIATELFLEHNVPGTEKYEAIARTVPVKRMGRPKDVTAAVAFLISDEASFITGQLLHVCGGMSLSAAPV